MISYSIYRGYIPRIAVGITVMVLLLSGLEVVNAETGVPGVMKETGLSDSLQIPGQLDSSGNHFELKDSSYLNITLDSSESINLTLESAPEMVTMYFESASGAVSTQITLSGFVPQTTYHKYEDQYHNHVVFTTDSSGNYTYTQDLSVPHIVFIQPRAITKFIIEDIPKHKMYCGNIVIYGI